MVTISLMELTNFAISCKCRRVKHCFGLYCLPHLPSHRYSFVLLCVWDDFNFVCGLELFESRMLRFRSANRVPRVVFCYLCFCCCLNAKYIRCGDISWPHVWHRCSWFYYYSRINSFSGASWSCSESKSENNSALWCRCEQYVVRSN